MAQMATDGPLRAVLGPLTETLRECAGGCGFRVLSQHHWGKVEKAKRKRLLELKVRRNDSAGRCWKCSEQGLPGNPKREFTTRKKIPPEVMSRLPEIWEQVRLDGGGLKELAKRLGVSGERARQLVKEHSLPRTHSSKEKAAIFLEELEHMHSLGQGVYAISKALGMTPDALVRKVDDLHYAGKTKVLFHGWHRRYDKEAA